MPTGGRKKRNPSKPRKTSSKQDGGGMKSSFTELALPDFIGKILAQYQDLLVHEVERDIKGKALAAVKDEAHLLHNQARERLHLMESDVQQRVQDILDQAREGIFEMVQQETENVFNELETRLQSLLEDSEVDPASVLSGLAHEWSEKPGDGFRKNGATVKGTRPLDGESEAEATKEGVYHQEAWLELPPPLDTRPLLEFYRGLSGMEEVRILRAVGSLDKGVSFYIRPKQLASVANLLRALPSVRDVRDETAIPERDMGNSEGADDHLTFRILLTSAGRGRSELN